MNLEKMMTGKIIKGKLNGKKIAEQWINVNGAILIAKQYAEEKCKKQKQLCKEPFMNNVYYDDVCDKIDNAPLATED